MVKLFEDRYKLAYAEFLRRLRDARLRQGLTQRQAAAQAGRDQYWLSRCETGALADQAADENEIQLSGIAQRIWTPSRGSARQSDLCVRLSIYDRFAEIIPPEQIGDRRRDPQGQLPTRQAHYATLRFPAGRTAGGENVSLSPNAELRVSAYLRSVPYKQSLHEILTRLQLVDRLREDDDQHTLQRLSHYIVVGSCICFGHVPFTQLT